MRRIAVLASGRGSNLQALLDAGLPITCVVSDQPAAGALERARGAGIEAVVLGPQAHPTRAAFEAALHEVLEAQRVQCVVLAGFMRILGSEFVQRWSGRMVNIHPSLLPKYRGLHTHRRVLEAGDAYHGASVHFVDNRLDGGPVVLQSRIAVHAGDDEASLARRVQAEEHRVYPWVVRMLADGRLVLGATGVTLDGKPLPVPLMVNPDTDLTCLAA